MRYLWILLVLALVGCKAADPNMWVMYAKANYIYGRIEAKAETHCKAPTPADRVDVCTEAKATQQAVKTMAPLIQDELTKPEPDWNQIMKYVDLVFSLAGKLL